MATDAARGADPVVLEAISKFFGEVAAVREVTFRVGRGEGFGLLGPNGAGKSTTLKMIYGSLKPTRGRVWVEGVDVALSPREAKRRLGVAPQEDTLDPELTVGQNLVFHARYAGLGGQETDQRVRRLLQTAGLDGRASARVDELSAGLRRRLVLARALVTDASVVILDEPTRGLDRESRDRFLEELRERKDRGVTLLLATHELDDAEALCDRVAVVEGGRLVELLEGSGRLRAARRGRLACTARGAAGC